MHFELLIGMAHQYRIHQAHLSALLFMLLVGLFNLPGLTWGATMCREAHTVTASEEISNSSWNYPELPILHKNELNPKLLKKYDFSLSADGTELLDLKLPEGQQVVGKLKVLKTKYLFQWADKAYQKDLLMENGISHEWMNDILEGEPQVAGVGFYVSINPIDSSSYGSELTVFETSGPVKILELTHRPSPHAGPNTVFAKRLRSAGIEAVSFLGYTQTWLAMISENQLNKATKTPADVIATLTDQFRLSLLLGSHVELSPGWLKQFPKRSFLRRFGLGEKLIVEELESLRNFLSHGWNRPLLEKLAFKSFETLMASRDPKEALGALTVLQKIRLEEVEVDRIVQKIEKVHPATNNYRRLLRVPFSKILAQFDSTNKSEAEFIKGLQSQTLAIADPLQVDGDPSQLKLIQKALIGWISDAQNDRDFLKRSRLSVELIFQLYPELRARFPGIPPLDIVSNV
jgi:hypothetical protein